MARRRRTTKRRASRGAPAEEARPLGGTPRLKASGLGVAAKFSLAAAAVVAVSMLVFAMAVNHTVGGMLSREIDDAGVQAAVTLAATDAACWLPFHGTVLEGREKEFEGESVRLPAEQIEDFRRRRDANLARAAGIAAAAGGRVLDVVILDAAQERVINGRGDIRFEPSAASRSVRPGADAKDEVKIVEGRYQDQRGSTRARTYSTPIRDDQGQVAGYVVLALSEEAIGSSLSRLIKLVLMLALMFVGVGLLVSWFVGQRITRPVAQLLEDIEVVAEGDLEHRTHPHSQDEIGVVARTFDRMTQNVLAGQELEKRQAAREHELKVARQVQEALLPEHLPDLPGYECAAKSHSVGGISGNYYDGILQEDGSALFVLASASGDGVPAAMVMTMARSLIQAVATRESSPATILRRVNAFLSPDLRRGMYVTVLLARLEPASGRVTLANAGHHPLILCRPEAEQAVAVHADGIALGFDKGPVFDRTIKDVEVTLAAGDRVLFCTRSLFEVQDDAGRELGEEALYRVFARQSAKHTQVFLPMVDHAIEEHRGPGRRDADRVLLTVKRLA